MYGYKVEAVNRVDGGKFYYFKIKISRMINLFFKKVVAFFDKEWHYFRVINSQK